MCGIIGYIGDKKAKGILLDGLKKMEYRGYDSSGLAIIEKENFEKFKVVGRISKLENKLRSTNLSGNCGIGHTRWATHGEPTVDNAHPHGDCLENVQVVHNGIIENYLELKIGLERQGHKFLSQTDTEVLAHLIENFYQGNLQDAVRAALNEVKGAYGLAVLHNNHPKEIVVAKLGSPLIIGIAPNEKVVVSDKLALPKNIKKLIYLEDGELATLTAKELSIAGFDNQEIIKPEEKFEANEFDSGLQGFPDFMLKEIFEQPAAIRRTLAGRIKNGKVKLGGLEQKKTELQKINRIVIVGCGTARLAGLVGEYLLEEFPRIDTEVEYASEFRYHAISLDPKTAAVLAISQSGETADTKAAVECAKQKGFLTIGIINVVGSAIGRLVDVGIYTHCGPEVAVASTKAFTSQIIALSLFCSFLCEIQNKNMPKSKRLFAELTLLPEKIETILKQNDWIKSIATKYAKYKNFAYLGRKYNFPVAQEGALKLKEISYVHAEGFPAGELKHGAIAMIDPDFPSVAIAPKDSVYEKIMSNAEEIKARRGKIIMITTQGDKHASRVADDIIYIPDTCECLYPVLATIPLQLFAYHMALSLKRDVDKPRNLAKSVTVE